MVDDALLLADEGSFGHLAQAMVHQQLMARGIRNIRVLQQMRSIPRHVFVRAALQNRAYDDCALPTLNDQTISQPYIVALMSEILDPQPEDYVLEIGTGSGYQTMILARLSRSVVSIERDPELAAQARQLLERFNVNNVEVVVGDGTLGWPDRAPYDRILVTAASPDVPPALLSQLADGGRMVIPVGDRTVQKLRTVDRHEAKVIQRDQLDVRFVPLIGAQGWNE